MRIIIIHLTTENKIIIRDELINEGINPSDIDKLIIGRYYKLSRGVLSEISVEEYYYLKSKDYAVPLVSGALASSIVACSNNRDLNVDHYNDTDDSCSYRTGHGYSFEDLNNNAFKKAGYKVNSRIGKTHEKGGPDAEITDRNGNKYFIQYKCCKSARKAALKIAERDGYPNQILYVNPEIEPELKRILLEMESDGKVPVGTSKRVIASCITYSKADRVSRFATRESLMFDARQALPTEITAFFITGIVSLGYNIYKEGEINKKVVKKSLKFACLFGFLAFVGHIGYNQRKRL